MVSNIDYTVIGGPASEDLAKKIAKKLNAKYLKTKLKVFPDGEQKITIEGKVWTKKIIVVQSTSPPVDSNLFLALCLISKAKEFCSEVIAVVPYFGYAKQDKEFLKGEIISLSVMAKLFESVGMSKLIVIDFHSEEGLNFFNVPIKNLTALPLLGNYLKKYNLKDPLIVSPDLFWKEKGEKLANFLNANFIAINKKRNRKTGNLQILSKKPRYRKGGDLIIFDDMISTGGSVMKTINFLGKKNFRKIYLVCTHPVLVGRTEEKLSKLTTTIIGTNTIVGDFHQIDLSNIVSKEIANW